MDFSQFIMLRLTKKNNEGIKHFVGDHTKKFLKFFEDKYTENGSTGFMVGSSWTVADFIVLTLTHTYLTHEFYEHLYGNIIDDYPELKKFTEDRVADMKEYLDSRENHVITYAVLSKLEYLPEDE